MQKGTVLSLRQLNSVLSFLKNNWSLLTLTLMFLSGLGLSTILYDINENFFNISKMISDYYLTPRLSENFLKIFKSDLLINFIFLTLTFIFGTSVTGITFIPVIISLRGMLFGSIACSIFFKYTLKGLAFNAILLIPTTVISVIFLIIGAKEAMYFSLQIINITLPQTSPKNLAFNFNQYCKCYLLLSIPTILSALLCGWLSIKLISYFNF